MTIMIFIGSLLAASVSAAPFEAPKHELQLVKRNEVSLPFFYPESEMTSVNSHYNIRCPFRVTLKAQCPNLKSLLLPNLPSPRSMESAKMILLC